MQQDTVETSLANPSPQSLPPQVGGERMSEGQDDAAGETHYRSQRDAAFAKRLAAERRKWAQESDARLETERGKWAQEAEAELTHAREEAEARAVERIRSRNSALPDVLRSGGPAPGASLDYAGMPSEQFGRIRRGYEAEMRMGKRVRP